MPQSHLSNAEIRGSLWCLRTFQWFPGDLVMPLLVSSCCEPFYRHEWHDWQRLILRVSGFFLRDIADWNDGYLSPVCSCRKRHPGIHFLLATAFGCVAARPSEGTRRKQSSGTDSREIKWAVAATCRLTSPEANNCKHVAQGTQQGMWPPPSTWAGSFLAIAWVTSPIVWAESQY